MGLFDWLRGRGGERTAEVASAVFPEVEGAEDYERLIREVGALTGIDLRTRCRSEGRGVVLEIARGDDRFVHTQEGWFADLEALLPVLNGWLPREEPRRLLEYAEDRFGEEFGIAFVHDDELEALRAAGWRIFTRDAPRRGAHGVGEIRLEGELTFHEDGAPRTGVLAADTVIDGVPCADGATVEFDVVKIGQRGRRGTLLSATLSRPHEAGGVTLPAGTRVHLYEEVAKIAVAHLEAPATLAGLALPPKTELEFGEDGRLYMAILGAPATVDLDGPFRGRTLPAGTIVSFRDGAWDLDDADVPEPPPAAAPSKTETRRLAAEETIDGYAFEAGAEVTTHEGALVGVTLPEDTVLDGVPCAAGFVGFSLGKLSSARLTETIVRDGIACRAGTMLLLWSDGALSEATLAEPAMVAGFELPAGSRVGFYEEIGNPFIIVVPTDVTLGDRACIPGQVIELDPDGRVERVGHITEKRHALTYALRNDGGAPYVDCV